MRSKAAFAFLTTAMMLACVCIWLPVLGQLFVLNRRLRTQIEPGPKTYDVKFWMATALPILMAEGFYLMLSNVDVLILKTLTWGAMHGYAVSRSIRERTDDVLQVDDAALYQALHRLAGKGYVRAEWGVSENNRRARFYELTPAGRKALRSESVVWRRYAEAVFKVLEPA